MSIVTSHTNVSRSPSNASSPPPINWNTRPKTYPRPPGTLDGSQEVLKTGTAPTPTDDDARQLELLQRHLRLPAHSRSQNNTNAAQEDGSGEAESNGPLSRFEPQDGLASSNEQSEFLDLTAAFSQLSTYNNPVTLEPRPPPGFLSLSSMSRLSHLPNSEKYYAIVKGKCAGVYYGEWDDIRCLTDRVPGARYKGFKSLESATAFYLDAKTNKKVGYIRNPGDTAKFGPDEDAIQ